MTREHSQIYAFALLLAICTYGEMSGKMTQTIPSHNRALRINRAATLLQGIMGMQLLCIQKGQNKLLNNSQFPLLQTYRLSCLYSHKCIDVLLYWGVQTFPLSCICTQEVAV